MARQNTIAQAQNLCCFMFHFPPCRSGTLRPRGEITQVISPFPDVSAGAASAGQTDREALGFFSSPLPCDT